MATVTFRSLFENHEWREIRDCPGRYALPAADADSRLAIVDILGGESSRQARRYIAPGCNDPVWVAPLSAGGALLSYERPDGSMVHTLNTAEGIKRKLDQLGIELEVQAAD